MVHPRRPLFALPSVPIRSRRRAGVLLGVYFGGGAAKNIEPIQLRVARSHVPTMRWTI
jgi:hypothetical protein